MDIKQFHSNCINYAQRFYEKNGELMAIVLALKPNGDITLMGRPFANNQEKLFTYNLYAAILHAERSILYSFISESWFYTSTDKDIDINKAKAPSVHPNRKECLCVISTSKDGQQFQNIFEIVKKRNKKVLLDLLFSDGTDESQDNIDLFNRLGSLNPKELSALDMICDLPKPSWYVTIDKDVFNDVKVDS